MFRILISITAITIIINGWYYYQILEATYRYRIGIMNHLCEEITPEKEKAYIESLP